MSLTTNGLVVSANPCAQIDQFEWETNADGIYGKIKSKFSGQYLTLSKNWWQEDVFIGDDDGAGWKLQKWRIADGMLVNDMKTIAGKNQLSAVVSHDPATGKLQLSEISCGILSNQWELSQVQGAATEESIPEGRMQAGLMLKRMKLAI